jgi:hypothetical protein
VLRASDIGLGIVEAIQFATLSPDLKAYTMVLTCSNVKVVLGRFLSLKVRGKALAKSN